MEEENEHQEEKLKGKISALNEISKKNWRGGEKTEQVSVVHGISVRLHTLYVREHYWEGSQAREIKWEILYIPSSHLLPLCFLRPLVHHQIE